MIDRDVLISRVIDGEATAEDWSALHALAREDAAIWADLASAQQDHAELTQAVRLLTDFSEDMEAPILEHARAGFSSRLRSAAGWGGWAVAAVLAISFGMSTLGGSPPTESADRAGNRAGLLQFGNLTQAKEEILPELTPDEALSTYLTNGTRSGRVVALDPELHVMTAVPTKTAGQFEVVYVRRIVERAQVDLYRISQSETGQLIRLPVEEIPQPSRPF